MSRSYRTLVIATADIDQLCDLIDMIEELDPALASALRGLADRYDYGTLCQLFGD